MTTEDLVCFPPLPDPVWCIWDDLAERWVTGLWPSRETAENHLSWEGSRAEGEPPRYRVVQVRVIHEPHPING